MPRRTATLAVSGLLVFVLGFLALIAPVPYAELTPGPTKDTLGEVGGKPMIEIEGRQTYPTGGHLNMTTVEVTGKDYRMTLFEALSGWLSSDAAVVPKESVYPADKSTKEVREENAQEFASSQEHAKASALRAVGIPFTQHATVAAITRDSAAQGLLQPGDVIVAIDDTPVTTPEQVRQAVRKHSPGDRVVFTINRKGADGQQRVTVGSKPAPDDPKRAVVGIETGASYDYPFPIRIQLEDIGGPSAGLMFALGIVDKLTPGELNGGKFIAGTGTIDDSGKVGPIGGIQMKTIGARRAGATYFLTPQDNCAVAKRNQPEGLTLVKVGTLEEALKALEAIRAGQGIPTC